MLVMSVNKVSMRAIFAVDSRIYMVFCFFYAAECTSIYAV